MAAPASIADFKAKFDRDFPFGSGLDSVRDSDIQNAMDESTAMFPAGLFSGASAKQAYLLLSAHFVAVNIQRSGGLNAVVTGDGTNNRGMGIISSKSVGQVSVAYEQPPERIKRMAHLLPLWETEFGKKYLMMLQPKLVGAVTVVDGPSDVGVIPPAVPDAGP